MQPDCGLIGSGGVRVAPAREQRPSEPGVRIGVIGPALDDGARRRLKLVKAPEKLQGVPQVDVGARLVEVEPDRLPTFDRRVRVAPLGQQHAGERGVRRGSIRVEADHGAIGSLRLAISVLLGQHLSQIAVGPRVLGLDAHGIARSEEHTSELQSRPHLVCRLLLEKKKKTVYYLLFTKKKKKKKKNKEKKKKT